MKRNNLRNIFSWLLTLGVFGVFIADLLYKFGNYDIPFAIAFTLYLVYILLQRTTSRLTFVLISVLTVGMAFSYLRVGPVRITERIGEWQFLLFVFGIIQYIKEA